MLQCERGLNVADQLPGGYSREWQYMPLGIFSLIMALTVQSYRVHAVGW